MNRLSRLIATSFYSGYAPFAPGTVGSGLALVIVWLITPLRGILLLSVICFMFFLGVWAAHRVEKIEGHDASIINIDEVVGMWLVLLFLPESMAWFWWIGAFIVFRAFDILKPFPVGWSQSIPGGWGVMLDDVLAGLYTALFLRLFYRLFIG